MEKSIKKNGVTVIWDDEEIKDLFSVTNALYKITLPNNQVYYGSAELLADRIINHCSHVNGKHKTLFGMALKKYKVIKVSLINEYETIDEARKAEKRFINIMAKKVYNKLDGYDDFYSVVNTVLLNSEFYLSC